MKKIFSLFSINLFFLITFVFTVFAIEISYIISYYGLFILLFNVLFLAYTENIHPVVRKTGYILVIAIFCFSSLPFFVSYFYQKIDKPTHEIQVAWDTLKEVSSFYEIDFNSKNAISLTKTQGDLLATDIEIILDNLPKNNQAYTIYLNADDLQFIDLEVNEKRELIYCHDYFKGEICTEYGFVDIDHEEYSENVNSTNALNEQLKKAILDDNYYLVVKLVEEDGADPNYIDKNGVPMTQYSTVRDNNDISIYLFEKGANLNAQDDSGIFTSLVLAEIHGNNELVSYLLYKGADTTLITHSGETAYEAAVRMNHKDTANLLREKGSD